MQYKQLPKSYKYEVLAQAIRAREVEHFHYAFDAGNFERLLKSMPPGQYRDDLVRRLEETRAQMLIVEAIHAALCEQIDDPDAYAAAVEKGGAES